jgi:5-oxoprolinase (ATP-hydrolysing) subunit A
MLSIDLNCDMGEGFNNDESVMPFISSVNIACGYHAGNEETMMRTVELAIKNNIAIGAHPSYHDKENFGRTNIHLSPEMIYDIVSKQISLLNNIVKKSGTKLHHVKPHGALYNMAAKDIVIAAAICKAIKDFDEHLILYGLSGSELINAANEIGLKNCSEVFADRTYQNDGSLTPRNEKNALIDDINKSTEQVLQMVKYGSVISVSGKKISLIAETICIHGDGKHAVQFAKNIHSILTRNGIAIASA